MDGSLLQGPLGFVVAFIVLIWAILMLLAPFFWYGTNARTKEISEKLDRLIEGQERQLDAMNRNGKDSGSSPTIRARR